MASNNKEPEGDRYELLDSLPFGIIELGERSKIMFLNSKILERINSSETDLIGSFLYDIVEPSSISKVIQLIDGSDPDGKQVRVDLRTNGSRRLSGTAHFRIGRDGKEEGYFIATGKDDMDITMKVISLDVLEDIPLPMDIIKKDMGLHFQNSASEEMVSLLSKGKDPILKPTKERKAVLLDCFSGSKGGRSTVKVKTNEDDVEFDVIAVPVKVGDMEFNALEIWMETGKERGKDNRVELIKGIGDELIESSNAIIIGLDLEGNIKLFNKGARRALGYSFDEIEDRPWFDLLLDRDAEKGKLEVLQWNIGSGFRTQYESKVRSRSGMTLTISLENTVIFDDDGNVSLILMIGQDITKTKKLEESLREQTEKLIEAIEEADLYTDLMIHDMHNANAGIMGYLELLDLQGHSEDKKRDYVARALGEVRKSSDIIRDVKLMSRARPQVEPEPVDLQGSIMDAVGRIQEDPENKKVVFEIDTVDVHVLGDDLLQEAFHRIFENSLVHARVKGELKVQVRAKRDPSHSNIVSDPILITLEDNGGGMRSVDLDNAFHRPTRTDLGSHGLGLYLIKRVISRYGGMVWLENTEGKEAGLKVNIILREAV